MSKRSIITGLLAVGVGFAIGSAGEAEPEVRTVEVPVEKVVTKTVEKKVEVPVVPEACLKALDDADALTVIMSDVSTLVGGHLQMDSDIWNGLAQGDVSHLITGPAALTAFNEGIEDNISAVEANTYTANRDACRAS